jgi:hypothetical protein
MYDGQSLLTALLLLSPGRAIGGLILNAEVRVTAEDNIVGLLTGGDQAVSGGGGSGMMSAPSATGPSGRGLGGGSGSSGGSSGNSYTGSGSQSPSDVSMTVSAEAGAFTDVGSNLSFFAKGFAERTDYQTYSAYDQSSAGVAAGMTVYGGKGISVLFSGFDKIKRYDNDPDRDSTIYGGRVSVKHRPFRVVWFRESASYETSRATYQDFSYRGVNYTFRTGWDATKHLLASAGYGFQVQQYQDPAATALRSGTASVALDYLFTRRWSMGAAYDRETTAAGTSDVITRNNISSLSLRYSY